MISRGQIPRLQKAAQRYFEVTDDVEAMRISEVLFDVVNKSEADIEAMIRFYEEEDE